MRTCLTRLIPPLYASHLKEVLAARMELPVELAIETCEGCENCDRAVALALELMELSDRITIKVDEPLHPATGAAWRDLKRPSLTVRGRGASSLVFYGAPIGSELDVLVDALFAASRERSRLPPSMVRALRALREDVYVEIFVSPACRRCPPVVRFLMEAGIESNRLSVNVVEAYEFPDLTQKYGVKSVPAVVVGSGAVKLYDATVAKVAALLLEMATKQARVRADLLQLDCPYSPDAVSIATFGNQEKQACDGRESKESRRPLSAANNGYDFCDGRDGYARQLHFWGDEAANGVYGGVHRTGSQPRPPKGAAHSAAFQGGDAHPVTDAETGKEKGVKIHACSSKMGLFGTEKEGLSGVVDDVIRASSFLKLATDPDAVILLT